VVGIIISSGNKLISTVLNSSLTALNFRHTLIAFPISFRNQLRDSVLRFLPEKAYANPAGWPIQSNLAARPGQQLIRLCHRQIGTNIPQHHQH
jgi:hypothetical protein